MNSKDPLLDYDVRYYEYAPGLWLPGKPEESHGPERPDGLSLPGEKPSGPGALPTFSRRAVDRARDMPLRESDVLLASYPKTGQTWLMTINHLLRHSKELEAGQDYNLLDLYLKMPFVELERSTGELWADISGDLESPRFLRTHLPYQIWRDNLEKHPELKIIQTVRNPKDTMVSYYHHFRSDAMIGQFNGSWDQFFEWVTEVRLPFGDLFRHAADWYQFNINRRNSLVLPYEEMINNTRNSIIKIANFLGVEIENSKVIDLIIEKSSFKNMNTKVNGFFKYNKTWDSSKSQFIRKGKIGDWTNYFTNEQSAHVDMRCDECLTPLGLTFQYS